MIWERLFVRIMASVVLSLLVFSVAAFFIVKRMEALSYDNFLVQQGVGLLELVLPPAGASPEDYDEGFAIAKDTFGMDFTLYDANQQFITSTGIKYPLVEGERQLNRWSVSADHMKWTTQLTDGRWMVVVHGQSPDSEEVRTVMSFLAATAVILTLVMFPVIRNLTSRLERLQAATVEFGSGKLRTRVDVHGRDEVGKLAHSFNTAMDEIERLVESQRLLLANTSHELRTPLARIRLGIDLLEEKIDPARHASLRHNIAELNELIDELLILSRLDAPEAAAQMEVADLVAIAAEECARYDNCTLHSAHVPKLLGSPKLLRRLIRNLVDNGLKHGAPPVSVEISEVGDQIVLSVSDGGEGIRPDDEAHVFDPFYRASDKQNVAGYGLGLAIVKRIADAHRADISVKTAPISTVVVTFPVETRIMA